MSVLKVSIVIPLYNKERYIERALDSIAAQTFTDFEAIVVDDGSTDGGASMVANYPGERFRLIRQSNQGPGAARNAAIAQASGEFIAFLDADDEWLPNYLEDSVRLLESSGREVASVTSGYLEYPSGASTEHMWRKRGLADGIHRVQPETLPALVVSMLAYMSPCSTVARAEIVRKWNGFYEKDNCVFGEDAVLWLKVLLNETVAFNLKPLVRFHREASGLSRNLNGARPVEPFLKDPGEIEAACPPHLKDLWNQVIAIRAAKTACVLGYWGDWRAAGEIMRRFTSARNWRLPYHAPAVVCSTRIGSILGSSWRAISRSLPSQNGHAQTATTLVARLQTARPSIKIVAVVEATNVNAVAKNMFEFYRAANELRERSFDFPIAELSLVTFDRAESSAEFVAAARQLGLEVDVIHENGRFDRNVISALRKIVEQRTPDIVVTHQVKSHFLMNISRLWRKYSWVAFNHGYTTTDRKMLLYNRLDRCSLPKADLVVTVCDAFAKDLVKMGLPRERIHVQHNSIRPEPQVNAEDVRALKRTLGIIDEDRVVLAVGRLSHEKAHIELLRAFKLLLDSRPEMRAKLIIVGDGPERAKLEAAAKSLGISDRVIFAGRVTDVSTFYAAADVLANPSHSEGSPYVLLETMAAGVPIVATAVGGVPEMVIDNESALLVSPRNPDAMASAIASVLSDKALALRLSANAYALVSKRFSPETYVRSLVDLYKKLICRDARANR